MFLHGDSRLDRALSIENDLMTTFMQRLRERDELNEELVAALRKAFAHAKLPKADELVRIISEVTGEGVA
jgi:hypothetical protein